ncbi:hypothetical protein C8F04DRAFT_1306088 [Mycena alexandri]|uniref:Uncharacterized protein n=1 Tax=Mycena alexandri TaxID=1745969 RepID=A0AAD6S8Z8_9AGAR|nr:hypothetical protein C8F04DRAFT_1306088 [Mycena alexandri]
MLSSVLVIVPFLAGIQAVNALMTNGASASRSMQISGSENAITDVAPAVSWQILGCDSTALSQNLRLVCMDEDDPASLCGHLYQNTGAGLPSSRKRAAVNSTSTSVAIDAAPSANSTDVALAERDASTSFGGCGLFDKDASVSLFTKSFQIFKEWRYRYADPSPDASSGRPST